MVKVRISKSDRDKLGSALIKEVIITRQYYGCRRVSECVVCKESEKIAYRCNADSCDDVCANIKVFGKTVQRWCNLGKGFPLEKVVKKLYKKILGDIKNDTS